MAEAEISVKDTYTKRYRMNVVGQKGATTTVAVPPQVIVRKARLAGITPEEFVKKFYLVAHYDNFDGIFYAFEEKQKDEV